MKHERSTEVELDYEFDLSDIKPEVVARMLKQAMKREAMRSLPTDKRKAAAEDEDEDNDYADGSDDSEIGEEMDKLADLKEESGKASPIPVSPEDMAKSTAKKLTSDLAAARDKNAPRKKS